MLSHSRDDRSVELGRSRLAPPNRQRGRTSDKDDTMPTTIRKAVIPAAGLGSRLLPLTKAIPKEMLPVGDKPVIEHTVRELVASGITDITIVVSGGKSLIQGHFRPNPGLVEQLRADGKTAYADAVEEIGELAHRDISPISTSTARTATAHRFLTRRGRLATSLFSSCGPTTSSLLARH